MSHNTRLVLRRLCCQSRVSTSHYDCRIRDSSKLRRRTRILWNASFSTMANNSKNNSNNNKTNNNIHGSNITKRNSNKHDVDDERYYRYQPPISEKVTNVFRRRLFKNANVDDLDKLHDWRETFSSPDYDDPWSAYIPLPTTMTTTTTMAFGQNSNDNVSKRGRVIESIINKTWHRRRHGMNLEPLHIIVTPPTKDSHHNNNNNDAMVESTTAKTQRIDVQTRYLCRMLDDVYRTGILREEIDRPTIGRCHRQIGRLLTMTPKDNNNDDDDNQSSSLLLSRSSGGLIIQGAAPRAGEILRRMEVCTPPSLLFAQRSMKKADAARCKKNGDDFLNYISGTTDIWPPPSTVARSNDDDDVTNVVDDDDDDEKLRTQQQQPTPSILSGSYQGLYPDYPHHLLDINFALPTPTRAIYNMVLLAYAKENGSIHVAQQAEDVIWSMISRANTSMVLIKNDNNDIIGDDVLLPLLPTTENWNCVLKCWSRNADVDRAFYAYSFLVSWIEWNIHYEDELNNNACVDGDRNSSSLDDIASPDLESFRLVLRSCLVNDEDDCVSKEYSESLRRAKEMGSGVAVRLWKEMQNYSNSNGTSTKHYYDSTIYQDMIHAICQTCELPSTSTSPSSTTRRALRALASVYKQCSDDGMLTTDIFDLVKGAMSKSQFARLLHGQGRGMGSNFINHPPH